MLLTALPYCQYVRAADITLIQPAAKERNGMWEANVMLYIPLVIIGHCLRKCSNRSAVWETPQGRPQVATNALLHVNEFSMKNSLASFYERIPVA